MTFLSLMTWQFVDKPTCIPDIAGHPTNVLDLDLTSCPDQWSTEVLPPLGTSDHSMIYISNLIPNQRQITCLGPRLNMLRLTFISISIKVNHLELLATTARKSWKMQRAAMCMQSKSKIKTKNLDLESCIGGKTV